MSDGIISDGPERLRRAAEDAEREIRTSVRAKYKQQLSQARDKEKISLEIAMENEIRAELKKLNSPDPSPESLF